MTDALQALAELRAAMDAEVDARAAYTNARGRGKRLAYDAFYDATKRRHAAEDVADAILSQRVA